MKIWREHSAEHSAAVKVIGTFATPSDASMAEKLFNDLVATSVRFEGGAGATAALNRVGRAEGVEITEAEAEQLRSLEDIAAGGREIRVETEALEIDPLLKVLSRYGATVRIVRRARADVVEST